jgi:flagellin
VTLSVNTDGVSSAATVAAYSVDELIAQNATFTTNTVGGVTTQLADVGGTDFYVKVDDSNWVKATDVTGTGQEALQDEGGV